MHPLEKYLLPDRQAFAADPFGYAALAWYRWALAQELAGLPTDPERPPTAYDLKSPGPLAKPGPRALRGCDHRSAGRTKR